jgi:hypothetical protein
MKLNIDRYSCTSNGCVGASEVWSFGRVQGKYWCVCVCVCVCTYIHVYMCESMHVCMKVLCMCVYVWTHICYVSTYYVHVCVFIIYVYIM